jgi:Sugar phosphate isomerases/epimerases
MRIGVQLYSLKNEIKDGKSLSEILKFVKDNGAETAELAGSYYGLTPREVGKIADDNGIKIVSTHTKFERFLKEPEIVVEEHLVLGAETAGIPSLPERYYTGEGAAEYSGILNGLSEKFKKSGLYIHHHNHSKEFKKIGGKYWLDAVKDLTDPAVKFCVDAYWAVYSGVNLEAFLPTLSGRLKLVHVKDLKKNFFGMKKNVPAGDGIIDFKKILPLAEKTGAAEAIIELEKMKDPKEAVKKSLFYIANIN